MDMPKKNEMRKPTRSISGVSPIAIMPYPRKCDHGTCTYCPSLNVPQSYTPKSPPVIRAIALHYDAFRQTESRLKAFNFMNHPTNKIEVIIMGGTFPQYPIKYQYDFVKRIYDALNKKESKTLKEARKLNEKAKHRCVALCIETRPDNCTEKDIRRFLEFGCTRVELGVQIIDDKIYKRTNRGHNVQDVIDATKRLKQAGFKVGYHIMTGLPGATPKKDLELFKKLFRKQDYKPDQLKLYPCQVIQGSALKHLHERGEYKPYSEKQIKSILIKMMELVPRYCRVMRIMREIPPEYLVSGTKRIDLRKEVQNDIEKKKLNVKEIRFREIGFSKTKDKKTKIKVTQYNASEAKEYFIEAVNKEDILFGLCRLRLQKKTFLTELKNAAIIRELHVYGGAKALKEKQIKINRIAQHKGLGKKLMKKAEEISRKEGYKKIAVISGVGVREYYKALGYKLDKNYMIKKL